MGVGAASIVHAVGSVSAVQGECREDRLGYRPRSGEDRENADAILLFPRLRFRDRSAST